MRGSLERGWVGWVRGAEVGDDNKAEGIILKLRKVSAVDIFIEDETERGCVGSDGEVRWVKGAEIGDDNKAEGIILKLRKVPAIDNL